jgi:hypothetical protein
MRQRDNQGHCRKQREHCQIDGSGDGVPTTDIFAKGPILENHGQQEFGRKQ